MQSRWGWSGAWLYPPWPVGLSALPHHHLVSFSQGGDSPSAWPLWSSPSWLWLWASISSCRLVREPPSPLHGARSPCHQLRIHRCTC